tara:strand:- start:654 stop:1928 length:1275 start_codon:yes stop_codon:yes gene_type:complete
MNILQIEDDIKSLPDQNLMEAMQTGSFPQYLVLSELKRRKEMRDDYKGKMAAQSDQGTVADKIMSEASMGINNQGIGSITPPNMQSMQGMPQNTPQLPPQDQGIGQIMPSNMKGMAAGGVVQMAPGQTVPYGNPYGYDMLNPQGVGQFYDFYKERMQPTQAELDYQEMMRAYFDPEEAKKRNKTNQGLNLVRAGLAVSGSATPEQLSKNLDPVISSAQTGLDARNKEGLMRAKFEADIGKQDRERDTNIAELAYKSQYAQSMVEQSQSRQSNWTTTARGLAVDIPSVYAVQLDAKGNEVLDPKTGQAIITGKPNQRAYDKAEKMIGYATVTSRGIAEQSDLKQTLAENVLEAVDSPAFENFVDRAEKGLEPGYVGLSEAEIRTKKEAEIRVEKAKELGITIKAGGGQISALPKDPPMLDLSSRF